MTRTMLRKRPARVAPAMIVAVVLLLVAVALGWWAIAVLTGQVGSATSVVDPVTATWNAPVVAVAGAAVLIVGVILLLCAVIPGSTRVLATGTGQPAGTDRLEIGMTTGALATFAAASAAEVDGVASVHSTADARSVQVRVTTPVREHAEIRSEVADTVDRRMRAIGLERSPRVSVTVRSTRS